MRVIGIDPSLKSTGYGIIELSENRYTVLDYGCIKPSSRLPLQKKLEEINNRINKLIHTFNPNEVAIENLFYAQNIKTAITLGQVRGAVLVAVASQGRDLFEYSALEIKKSVTGYGQADKNQVKTMVKTLLGIEDDKLETDASDALAAAFCHLNSRMFQLKIED
jgi:crossover junction endodeoxyribonuclease RuvC